MCDCSIVVFYLQKVKMEMECRRPALNLLQSSLTSLATQSSLDNLTQEVQDMVLEWGNLAVRVDTVLTTLHQAQSRWQAFTKAQAAALLVLTNIDAKLTQVEVLYTGDEALLDTHKEKLKNFVVSWCSLLCISNKVFNVSPWWLVDNDNLCQYIQNKE